MGSITLAQYELVYNAFSFTIAVMGAATVFSFFVTFIGFNFYNNGGGVTTRLGWLGVYLFFRHYFAESESRWPVILSGVALGFAYYCFDYALYYLFGAMMLWIVKENIHLWKQWRSILSLLLGFLIGAAPLIYYNLTHDFANFKILWWKTRYNPSQPRSVVTPPPLL